MNAIVLLGEVELPVVVEVSAGPQRAKPQDRFGTGQRPTRAGAAHTILHEVAARTLDHAGGDREAVGECAIVVEPAAVLDYVLGARENRIGGRFVEAVALRHASQALGDLAGAVAIE